MYLIFYLKPRAMIWGFCLLKESFHHHCCLWGNVASWTIIIKIDWPKLNSELFTCQVKINVFSSSLDWSVFDCNKTVESYLQITTNYIFITKIQFKILNVSSNVSKQGDRPLRSSICRSSFRLFSKETSSRFPHLLLVPQTSHLFFRRTENKILFNTV